MQMIYLLGRKQGLLCGSRDTASLSYYAIYFLRSPNSFCFSVITYSRIVRLNGRIYILIRKYQVLWKGAKLFFNNFNNDDTLKAVLPFHTFTFLRK